MDWLQIHLVMHKNIQNPQELQNPICKYSTEKKYEIYAHTLPFKTHHQSFQVTNIERRSPDASQPVSTNIVMYSTSEIPAAARFLALILHPQLTA